ncbi:MAG: peptidoglycan DD-metalloendopeptidase family protein [Maribacter sp.]|uniref:peptidoglycan DD-metalloendopeptidase family protein n=1 Tax=Maribacter sp. TaxID=1897614 RepID=UPI00329880DC
MEAFLLYILKSGAVLALFLTTYHLFLKKETFFTSNRLFLVLGLMASFIVPLITFTRTVLVAPQPLTASTFYPTENTFTVTETSQAFNGLALLISVYVLGVLFFSFRLCMQLWALKKIKNSACVVKQDKLTHVKTEKTISPFSFFKHIFYNPELFKRSDLKIILNHEKVHATQLHSLDILLAELVMILQWFNPIIWLYRKSIKENLEFLADAYTCVDKDDKKHYQYLLLQKVIGTSEVSIANPFFNSLIKKRIVMLNQNQSKKVNFLKLFIVLPLIMTFLVAFNIKEEIKFSEVANSIRGNSNEMLDFQSPIAHQDIKRISAGFGMGQNKFEKDKFHNGIDLVATTGTKVMASGAGTVKVSSQTASNGNYIIVEHESGYSTKYMHLKDRSVKSGEQIDRGATIGHVGNTGKSTGPHLHFEILKSDKPINPESLIAFKGSSHTKEKSKAKYIKKQATPMKKIELTIDKKTSDETLLDIKNDLKKQEIDFSYTVVRNANEEIIDLAIQITGKSENGGTFNSTYNSSDSEEPISPLVVLIDQEHNLVSIGSKGNYTPRSISIDSDDTNVWISSDGEEHKEIRIKKEDGKRVIIVDGEEVKEEDLEDMDIHIEKDAHVFISKNHKNNAFVHLDSDDDHDIKVISKKGNGFFFTHTDGDKEPLYLIDGKESTAKKVKRLDPDDIESIDVSKGEKAIEQYGKKAKDGVVEIHTKKN